MNNPSSEAGLRPQVGPFHESLRKPSRDQVWIVEQNGRVHSVHATYESAMNETGENLKIGAPWLVHPWGHAKPAVPVEREGLIERIAAIIVRMRESKNPSDTSFGRKWGYSATDIAVEIVKELRPDAALAKEARDAEARPPLRDSLALALEFLDGCSRIQGPLGAIPAPTTAEIKRLIEASREEAARDAAKETT